VHLTELFVLADGAGPLPDPNLSSGRICRVRVVVWVSWVAHFPPDLQGFCSFVGSRR
jgi:hypothetical protein